jgi:3-hydroxyacyl-CoA dehydrogenase
VGALTRRDDEVVIITIDHPPVNALSAATRRAIAEAVWAAEQDATVHAIVMIGARGSFSAGADISEFGTPNVATDPNLRSLIREIERCEKPVVAALDGTVMGGGLELALGCHYRVATARASLALPEVKLGLVPGAGGTQRLPRAIGVEAAVDMMTTGEPRSAAVLATIPDQRLLDALVEDPTSLESQAVTFARSTAAHRPLPRLRDRAVTHPDLKGFMRDAMSKQTGRPEEHQATSFLYSCVWAAVDGSFDDGLLGERAAFVHLMSRPESRALRYAFFAERAAGRVDGVPKDTPVRTIASVGIAGSATVGAEIAERIKAAGIEVVVCGTDSLHVLSNADLIIAAVPEESEATQGLFRSLDRIARAGAVLATSTAARDLDAVVGATNRANDVIGLHFPDPATTTKLMEIARGAATSPAALATVVAFAKRLRMTAVTTRGGIASVGERMHQQYVRQASVLVEDGNAPWQIDEAMQQFGMAAGPLGFIHSRESMLDRAQRAAHSVSNSDIVERLTLTLINEGARLLDAGVAARASDIDVIWTMGYGFPRWRGGPMHYADQIGIWSVVRMLERLSRTDSSWEPAPLLVRLAHTGASLSG